MKCEGWRNPTAAISLAILAAFVAVDLIIDFGTPWKTRLSFHSGERKASISIGAVNTDGFELVAVGVGVVALIIGALHRSVDEASMAILAGAAIALRRMRILPIYDELVKFQGQSYSGWERYAQDSLGNLQFMSGIMFSVMFISIVSQIESLRVSEVKKSTILYNIPLAAIAHGLVLGLVVKSLAVDSLYPDWRSKTLYYRDLATIGMPFKLYFEAFAVLAGLLSLSRFMADKNIFYVISTICVGAATGVEMLCVGGDVAALGAIKKTTKKPDRESRALTLLSDVQLWHTVQAALLVGAIFTQLMGDRFERRLTQEEIEELKKKKAERKAKAKAAAAEKEKASRDGKKALERKRMLMEAMEDINDSGPKSKGKAKKKGKAEVPPGEMDWSKVINAKKKKK